jgi:pyruvate kinase
MPVANRCQDIADSLLHGPPTDDHARMLRRGGQPERLYFGLPGPDPGSLPGSPRAVGPHHQMATFERTTTMTSPSALGSTGIYPVRVPPRDDHPRQTKIVATLGPASTDIGVIRRLVEAGMDVARLNFSHGTHAEHLQRWQAVRQVAQQQARPVAVLADLCGPKIRLGNLAAPVDVQPGEVIGFSTASDDPRNLSITYDRLSEAVQPGQRLLIDDGRIRTTVIDVREREVLCMVDTAGRLQRGKGVNLPDSALPIPCLTAKDLDDLAFAATHGADFVALSFVRCAADVLELRERLDVARSRARIVAKIEKAEAIADLEAIIEASDAVMVARGDLGVEVGVSEVPLLQKRIIDAARTRGRTVITATQMLESMIDSSEPTRAEVSDVANAILDGTSAVMLSAESASGSFPVRAVEVMVEIASKTESSAALRSERVPHAEVSTVLMHATCDVADEVTAAAIGVPTTSGSTARDLSRFRPHQPVVAATDDEVVLRQLALDWGIHPVLIPPASSLEEAWTATVRAAHQLGLVAEGDLVVLTGRRALMGSNDTSHIALQRVPAQAELVPPAGQSSVVTSNSPAA